MRRSSRSTPKAKGEATPLLPAQLARLVERIADSTLSSKTAKEVFDALWSGEAAEVDAIIDGARLEADHR